jgi:hypothetical protein
MIEKLIKKAKQSFPKFKYYGVGSWVRNEKDFRDYDIQILPPSKYITAEWESVLEIFHNQIAEDGKYVDAHIFPTIKKLLDLSGPEISKIKDLEVPRYFYAEQIPNIDKAKKLFDNLWVKHRKVIGDKQQSKGLGNSKYIVREL